MNRRCSVALAAAVCLLAIATPAGAQGASINSVQLRVLATRAADGNQPALAELREVTSVDGQPAALGVLLGTGTEAQVHARLIVLAAAGPQHAVSAASTRATAASILGSGRYGKATVPDPLLSVLGTVSRWLASLAASTPGGPVVFWVLAAAIVLALAVVGARRMLRRLEPAARAAAPDASGTGEDPLALEHEAQTAEERGAFSDAVRLRFRAGLLRLGARDAIDYRPSLLTADVARRLRSPQFDSLSETFERIAYGGAPARPADAEEAREGWRALLDRTGARK